jgi:hypothetical protein
MTLLREESCVCVINNIEIEMVSFVYILHFGAAGIEFCKILNYICGL